MFENVPEEIIVKALAMYSAKDTRYLKSAQIGKDTDTNTISLIGNFSIEDCCYSAPNSGHFNAVEAIICFNQMFYVALLAGVDKKMFPFCADVAIDNFDKYWQKVYIVEFEKIKFRKLINSASFYGKMDLKLLRNIGDKVYGDCCFGFGNDEACTGFTGNVKGLIPNFRER